MIEEIVTQLGIGAFGMYLLWRIADELRKQTTNHMVETNVHLTDICKTQKVIVDTLREIRDKIK